MNNITPEIIENKKKIIFIFFSSVSQLLLLLPFLAFLHDFGYKSCHVFVMHCYYLRQGMLPWQQLGLSFRRRRRCRTRSRYTAILSYTLFQNSRMIEFKRCQKTRVALVFAEPLIRLELTILYTHEI